VCEEKKVWTQLSDDDRSIRRKTDSLKERYINPLTHHNAFCLHLITSHHQLLKNIYFVAKLFEFRHNMLICNIYTNVKGIFENNIDGKKSTDRFLIPCLVVQAKSTGLFDRMAKMLRLNNVPIFLHY